MGAKLIDRGWKKLKNELNIFGSTEIVVGVLGGVEYAGYLEFGTSKMPPRPFMRQTFENYGAAMEARIATSYSSVIEGGSANREANRLGLFYQGRIQKEIRGGSFAPLSAKTIAQKGSSKPLIDTGRLIGSISYELR